MKKTKKKLLTPVQREIRRREAAVARNDRNIERIGKEMNVEIGALELKNKTHREILNALMQRG